jgi:hypothetical protein
LRSPRLSIALTIAAAALVAVPMIAEASDPFLQTLTAEELETAPAQRYAKMGREEALSQLRARGVVFEEVPDSKAPGVVVPIRLTSRLAGVHVHGTLPEAEQVRSPFEILDARLALTLHDFAGILARHEVDEIVHFTMFRPGGGRAAAPPPLPASSVVPSKLTPRAVHADARRSPGAGAEHATSGRARSATSRATPARPGPPPGHLTTPARTTVAGEKSPPPPSPSEGQTTSRHPAGLAIDVGAFRRKDGKVLSIGSHFQGHIGAKTCGQGAASPDGAEARALRAIVCEAAEARLFTYVLSPNFNYAHRDHLHMEIKGGVPWMIVH